VSTVDERLELRDVRGPSALGGGTRRFFDLLWLLSITEFKRTYFGTVLGYVWSLVRPLMLFAVLLFVFTRIFRIDVPFYPVILLFGIVMFTFFQEATGASVTSVVAQEGIVRKTQFPRLVIPLSLVLTGLMNLGLNLIAVFVFILLYGVDPMWTWLLLPVLVLPLTILTTAVSMLLSALYVRFRDVEIIWSVLASVLFYATPILYPIEIVKQQAPEYADFLLLNPLAPIFEQARVWIMIPAAAIFLTICGLGWWVFNREAPRIAESL
jgi:ABC-2 type transport system permease protein